MSWEALAWAKDSEISQPVAKFILVLLANKADENFSCYPSIRTLMAESGAGRSTVLRALSYLEMRGFMTRRPQFHDSGARRSTRYYLNHPRAQNLPPGPDPGPPSPNVGPPGPTLARGPSHIGTGAVSERHPTGVPNRDPLNLSTESPSEPGDAAALILQTVVDSWRLGTRNAHTLLPAIKSALAAGWPAAELTDHLIRNPNGARDPVRVLAHRLTDAWQAPEPPVTTLPWCGECGDAHSRTISVTNADGSEAARFCPQCSPQLHRDRPSIRDSVRIVERW
ncbi:helix-turn-helix domain-containing protein [Mycobacterium sp. TY815]|uniref:helix-turn-helix domain-containing protein n=1 Tax=Mycobacterium sp. TY815 TaxID=3050581 RepID=UPI002740B164|nr:helix-turn-helix domain-containing protein [Mycobacterium sp. TY815]MDP7701387.1 helix-turn-helix domain-containing protein [Mycobacterium sp. TY815]